MSARRVTPLRLLEICFWLIIVLLIVPLYINMGWRYSMDRADDPKNIGGMDFKAYYVAAQLALEGKSIYDWPLGLARAEEQGIAPDGSVYIYPPPMAALMIPLASLPIREAARVWFLINVGFLGAALVLLLRSFEIRRLTPLWIVGALLYTPVSYSLHMGQVNILILLLISAGYAIFKRGNEATAGGLIGLASIIKVAPGVLIAYYLWKKKWWAMVGALVAMTLVCISAVIVFQTLGGPGWDSVFDYAVEVLPQLGRPRANPYNQSFNGLFSLALVENPYFFPLIDSPMLWRGAVLVCSLVLVGTTIWLCPRRELGMQDLEMGLVVCAFLPLASITWTSTLTVLLFPYAALVGRLLRRPTLWCAALGGLSFLLVNSQRLIEVTVGWAWAEPWVLGAAWLTKLPLLGTLVLWGAVALALRRGQAEWAR